MKQILLLTTMLLALIAGKATAQGTTYRVPSEKSIEELNTMTLVNNDIIELTEDITGTLKLSQPIHITIQSAGDQCYTFSPKDAGAAISLNESVTLTLKNVTAGGIEISGKDLDITLQTEGAVTLSSQIKASSTDTGTLTINCNASGETGVEFKAGADFKSAVDLPGFDMTISGGKPKFTTNPGSSDNTPGLKLNNLNITESASPTVAVDNGNALSLTGNLTISTSEDCLFRNNSNQFNTIQFNEDAILNVTDMDGEFKVENEATFDNSNNGGTAINSNSKLTITGTSKENGIIIAIGAHSAIRANELEIEATTRIEAYWNGKGIMKSVAALYTSNPLTIRNADITIGEGTRYGIYTVGGIAMESGSLSISDQISDELSLSPDASLIIGEGRIITPNANFSLINNGTFINKGTFTNRNALTNNGTFLNEGVFVNDTSSVVNNNSVLINETNSNFTNKGTLNNEGTLTHNTDATLTNEIGGTLNNKGSLIIEGNITNNGVINNYKTIEGEGKITGNGKVIEHSQNSTYHTIALVVEEGIHSNYSAGDLTVTEGEHLYLTFSPQDPTLAAADILFLIDGVESTFKTSGNSGSYILNPITKDRNIVIALRQYPVTFPKIEGLTITATSKADYGTPFTFTISLPPLKLLNPLNLLNPFKDLKVFANNIELLPDTETGQAQSLQYTIDRVTGPITITIEGVNTTSNTAISKGEVSISIINYQLSIINSTDTPVDVTVYTITGKNFVQLRALSGSKSMTLPSGIYIVKAGQTITKVIIH